MNMHEEHEGINIQPTAKAATSLGQCIEWNTKQQIEKNLLNKSTIFVCVYCALYLCFCLTKKTGWLTEWLADMFLTISIRSHNQQNTKHNTNTLLHLAYNILNQMNEWMNGYTHTQRHYYTFFFFRLLFK